MYKKVIECYYRRMSAWKEYKIALKNKSLRYYLYSTITATFASGLAYIFIIWSILQTHSNVTASLNAMLLFWLPTLLLSHYFGALVDRIDRKKLIIVTELIRSVKFLIFGLLLSYHPKAWEIYLLTLLSGCFAALYKPLAPACVQEIVSKDELLSANTCEKAANQIGNIIGRGIFTVTVLLIFNHYETLFVIAFLYLLSGLLIIPIKRKKRLTIKPFTASTGWVKSIIDGYRYLITHENLIVLAFFQSVVLFLMMSAPVLIGPYVKNILVSQNHVFALAEGLLAAGSLIGVITWKAIKKKNSIEYCLTLASFIATVCYTIFNQTHSVPIAFIGCFFIGFAWGSFTLILTEVQQKTRNEYQGRVQSAIHFDATITMVLLAIFLHLSSTPYSSQNIFLWLAITSFSLLVICGIMCCRKKNKTMAE
jgi:MFS family permease